jgi:hypothetical protein
MPRPIQPIAVPFSPAPGIDLAVVWDGGHFAEVAVVTSTTPMPVVERWHMVADDGRALGTFDAGFLAAVVAYRLTRSSGLDRLVAAAQEAVGTLAESAVA